MKRKFRLYFFIFTACCVFTGCIDIIENLVLNKDGSGKYDLTIDMSELLNNPMMKGAMESGENPMKDMDSVVYLKDLPDSVIKDNPDLWKRVSMRIYVKEKEKALKTTIHLDFKSMDEINYVTKNLDKVMSSSKSNPLASGMGGEAAPPGMLSGNTHYSLSGKELTRTSETPKEKEEDTQDLEMMKTFLGGATYKVTYELPGKVRKVSIPKAVVKGKTVTTEASFMDLIEKKISLDGMIRFK